MATEAEPGRGLWTAGLLLMGGGAIALVVGLLLWGLTVIGLDAHTWDTRSAGAGLGLGLMGVFAFLIGLYLYGHGLGRRRVTSATFITPEEEERLMEAIAGFERRTSGELRVHLSDFTEGDILDEARRTFEGLGLTETRQRNAVLFFVSVRDHRFAVLGDEGIDRVVADDFWDGVVEKVQSHFAQRRFAEGLVVGIRDAGEALAAHFPPSADDVDELPDQISRDT